MAGGGGGGDFGRLKALFFIEMCKSYRCIVNYAQYANLLANTY